MSRSGMMGSGYASVCMTDRGEHTSGFLSPRGVGVSLVRNSVELMIPGGHVVSVRSGSLVCLDTTILVLAGPQNGCFLVAWSGSQADGTLTGVVGCSVFGLSMDDGDDHWVGVQGSSLEWFSRELKSQKEVCWDSTVYNEDDESEEVLHHRDMVYVHDIPERLRNLRLFLEEDDEGEDAEVVLEKPPQLLSRLRRRIS